MCVGFQVEDPTIRKPNDNYDGVIFIVVFQELSCFFYFYCCNFVRLNPDYVTSGVVNEKASNDNIFVSFSC